MCLDGQTGAFAVLNKSFQPSRKLYNGFVVFLNGTEFLMTGTEHSLGLGGDQPETVICAGINELVFPEMKTPSDHSLQFSR